MTHSRTQTINEYYNIINESKRYKNILYVYGHGSSEDSETRHLIQAALDKSDPDYYTVHSYHYDQMNPEEGLRDLKNIITDHNIGTVIGTSLGGWYTLMLPSSIEDTRLKKIVVNPSLRPSVDLLSADGIKEDDLKGFKRYDVMRRIEGLGDEEQKNIIALFGDADSFLPTRYFTDTLKVLGHANTRFIKAHHRLDRDAVERYIVPNIEDMVPDSRDE